MSNHWSQPVIDDLHHLREDYMLLIVEAYELKRDYDRKLLTSDDPKRSKRCAEQVLYYEQRIAYYHDCLESIEAELERINDRSLEAGSREIFLSGPVDGWNMRLNQFLTGLQDYVENPDLGAFNITISIYKEAKR